MNTSKWLNHNVLDKLILFWFTCTVSENFSRISKWLVHLNVLSSWSILQCVNLERIWYSKKVYFTCDLIRSFIACQIHSVLAIGLFILFTLSRLLLVSRKKLENLEFKKAAPKIGFSGQEKKLKSHYWKSSMILEFACRQCSDTSE